MEEFGRMSRYIKPTMILDALYDFLISVGYEMSDMEKELQNGSHALFGEAPGDE